jgi:DNA replication initiation complex subunit (GINS family)
MGAGVMSTPPVTIAGLCDDAALVVAGSRAQRENIERRKHTEQELERMDARILAARRLHKILSMALTDRRLAAELERVIHDLQQTSTGASQ